MRISEEGFRSAAATAVDLVITGFPPEEDPRSFSVHIDRPFGFLAVHRELGLVDCRSAMTGPSGSNFSRTFEGAIGGQSPTPGISTRSNRAAMGRVARLPPGEVVPQRR
jgi:hypothetical protein